MKKIKNVKQIYSAILLSLTLCCIFIQSFGSISEINATSSNQESVSIEKINSNSVKIHYNSVTASNRDILFTKSVCEDGYCYQLCNLETNENYGSFKINQDIIFDNNKVSTDPKMCAAAWAIIQAVRGKGDPVQAILGALGGVSGGSLLIGVATDIAGAIAIGGFQGAMICAGILASTPCLIPFIAASGGVL